MGGHAAHAADCADFVQSEFYAILIEINLNYGIGALEQALRSKGAQEMPRYNAGHTRRRAFPPVRICFLSIPILSLPSPLPQDAAGSVSYACHVGERAKAPRRR